jgi:hypothetical protein
MVAPRIASHDNRARASRCGTVANGDRDAGRFVAARIGRKQHRMRRIVSVVRSDARIPRTRYEDRKRLAHCSCAAKRHRRAEVLRRKAAVDFRQRPSRDRPRFVHRHDRPAPLRLDAQGCTRVSDVRVAHRERPRLDQRRLQPERRHVRLRRPRPPHRGNCEQRAAHQANDDERLNQREALLAFHPPVRARRSRPQTTAQPIGRWQTQAQGDVSTQIESRRSRSARFLPVGLMQLERLLGALRIRLAAARGAGAVKSQAEEG